MATGSDSRPSRRRGARRVGNAIVGMLFAAWLTVMTWYVWPRSEAQIRFGTVIVAPHHEMIRAGSLVLLALLCATVVWLFVGGRGGRRLIWQRQVGLLALQLGLVFGFGSPILVMLWHGYNAYCRPWRDVSELRAADGKMYHVHFLGNISVLSEEVSADRLFLQARVIGRTDYRDEGVPVVRPAGDGEYDLAWAGSGREEWGGRLLGSGDGRWVVFAYADTIWDHSTDPETVARIDCRMTLAYETEKGRFHAGGSLTQLSPFLLVGANDEVHEDDIEGLLSIERYSFKVDDTCEFGLIAEGAAHAKASVRRVAAQMLGEYWDEYEAAQATLRELAESDPDETVREVAKAALVTLDERRAEEARWAE